MGRRVTRSACDEYLHLYICIQGRQDTFKFEDAFLSARAHEDTLTSYTLHHRYPSNSITLLYAPALPAMSSWRYRYISSSSSLCSASVGIRPSESARSSSSRSSSRLRAFILSSHSVCVHPGGGGDRHGEPDAAQDQDRVPAHLRLISCDRDLP